MGGGGEENKTNQQKNPKACDFSRCSEQGFIYRLRFMNSLPGQGLAVCTSECISEDSVKGSALGELCSLV